MSTTPRATHRVHGHTITMGEGDGHGEDTPRLSETDIHTALWRYSAAVLLFYARTLCPGTSSNYRNRAYRRWCDCPSRHNTAPPQHRHHRTQEGHSKKTILHSMCMSSHPSHPIPLVCRYKKRRKTKRWKRSDRVLKGGEGIYVVTVLHTHTCLRK